MNLLKNKRRWLLISYCSNLDGSACGQHLDDRLPYFRQSDVEVVLLSSVTGYRHSSVIHKRVPSVAPSGVRFELRHLIRKRIANNWLSKVARAILVFPVLPFYMLEKIIMNIESEWSWFILAAEKGRRLVKQYRPEVIFSTGGSVSAHLAAYLIAKQTKIPWIAEFQDPLVHEDWPRSQRALKLFQWIERLVCRNASAVVFVTRVAMENCSNRTHLDGRGHVIYPGARSRIFPDVRYIKKDICHFVHLGSLSGPRNLEVFLDALKRVLDLNPKWQKLVRLDLYGYLDRNCCSHIASFPYQGVVNTHGKISRNDSLAVMLQSDCLLLIQHTQAFSSETIPSKVYEYLFSNRPILALTHHNPELDDMLRKQEHLVVPADNVNDVCEGIKEMLFRFEQNAFDRKEHPMNRFETKNAVKSLLSIGSEITEQ